MFRLPALILVLPLSACVQDIAVRDSRPPLTVQPGEALLFVAAPALQAQAPMKLVGSSNGVDTWMSADRYSVSLQDGVVVATRGFGFDLMGADAEATLRALAAPGSGPYARQLRYLASDNRSTWTRAGCRVDFAVDTSDANRMEEVCTTYSEAFTNTYWLGAAGQILQSRQWVSAEVGYLDIEFVGR